MILIEGLGAIGGTFAARLIEAGQTPTLVAGNPAIASAINVNGITLRGGGREQRVSARAMVSLGDLPSGAKFDIAFLCMKANDVVDAARRSVPYLSDGGFVVSFQNGVAEPLIAEAIGAHRVVGGVLHWAATMHEPGIYEPTITKKIILGELDGGITPRLSRLKAIVGAAAAVELTHNITGALWSKLALNCTITTLGGLTGLTLSELLADARGRRVFVATYREVIDAANAHSIRLSRATVDPYGPYLAHDADADERRRVDDALAELERIYGPSRPSILQSLHRRKPTEVDFINGRVVAAADHAGIPAPLNAAVTRMIHEIERGQRDIARENLRDLEFR